MRRTLGEAALLPLVALAAARVAWLYPRLPLDELVRRLGSVTPLPAALRDPGALRRAVNRWLPWLPPRGLRTCLRRSLILVDLWSRCGLPVELHLGVEPGGTVPSGHAWVTAPGEVTGGGEDPRYEPAFVLSALPAAPAPR